VGTDREDGKLIAAVVAEQGLALGMKGEGHAAVAACEGATALSTESRVGETPAVQKKEGLASLFQVLGEGLLEGRGEEGAFFSSEIHDVYVGQDSAPYPLCEVERCVLSPLSIIKGFK
jgi:hypothetical protein